MTAVAKACMRGGWPNVPAERMAQILTNAIPECDRICRQMGIRAAE